MAVSSGQVHAPEDCALLLPLVHAHIEYERSDTIVPDDRAHLAARLIDAGTIISLTARVEEQVAGYASLTSEIATWKGSALAHLDCLYVAADQKKKRFALSYPPDDQPTARAAQDISS